MKKTLIALFLALICLLPFAVMAEGEEPIVYVNDFVKGNNEIEVRFLSTKNNDKTDATLLLCKGEDGMQIVVIDGGLANTRCYAELVELRKDLLRENGLQKEQRNANYKIRVTLVVTHCHKDHVAELYANLIPSKTIDVEALYLPQKSTLPIDNTYDDSKNGDHGHRTKLMEAMKQYAPEAPIHVIDFQQTMDVELLAGAMKLYGPESDYGTPEGLKYIHDTYYTNKPLVQVREDVPVAVTNANCMWARIELGESSILFTGDTMKKKSSMNNEPFDNMIKLYGAEELKSDIVKYPHHGISRNPAAKVIADNLYKEGGVVVLTTKDARNKSGVALFQLNIPFVTTEDGDYTFVMTETGYQKTEGK